MKFLEYLFFKYYNWAVKVGDGDIPSITPVLSNLQFGSRDYQHFQCEKILVQSNGNPYLCPPKRKAEAMEATANIRGLQIPLLDTSELQIRWNWVSSWMVNVAGLYTYVEGVLHYSETLGKWMDKQGTRRPLHQNGNQHTGGKIKYGKAVGQRFARASNVFTGLGMIISAAQFKMAENDIDKIKYGADFVVGGFGFLPGGTLISTFWFLGGRELVFQYGNTMGELMKEGINPGMPAYQPFK